MHIDYQRDINTQSTPFINGWQRSIADNIIIENMGYTVKILRRNHRNDRIITTPQSYPLSD